MKTLAEARNRDHVIAQLDLADASETRPSAPPAAVRVVAAATPAPRPRLLQA